jgi:phosphoribosyl 1,2-cyclic phosphate phosphodiesterase
MTGAGEYTFRILGCGSSPGVPRMGGDWGACDPHNPRNRRRRAALLVTRRNKATGAATRVLIDTGPDLREQMLDAGIEWVDGVVYTHPHADHIHGIDDLRSFVINRKRLIDIHADAATQHRLEEAFGYCFTTPPGSSYPPILRPHLIEPGREIKIDGPGGPIALMPYQQQHGDIHSLGFRIGDVAYSPDVSAIDERAIPCLGGLAVWILDALRYKPHPSHFSVAEALEWIDRMAPARAILTHMHVDLDYATLSKELPLAVEPAYDGLEFTC